jgi:uncharacterized C2H2 Zn-finger protein
MRFCDKYKCDNVLESITRNDELIYRCPVCFEEYESTPEDTLMIDEFLQENDTTYKHRNYLKNAQFDTISELEQTPCANTNCKETIIRVIKINKNGQALFVCPTCGTKFN